MSKRIDMTGKKFGRLTIVSCVKHATRKELYWECLCDCGGTAVISGYKLRTGHTQSCGCIHSEVCAEMLKTHGYSYTPTHISWRSMIQRCIDPNSTSYPRYGARGITVCEKWLKFENFLEDMGDRPDGCSLDRIDVDGNYEPGNVRWATEEHQQNNKRNNHLIVVKGESMTIADAAREHGIAYHTLYSRIKMGWAIEDAVSIPLDRENRYTR